MPPSSRLFHVKKKQKTKHLNVGGSSCEYLLVDGEGDGHSHKREPAEDKRHRWSLVWNWEVSKCMTKVTTGRGGGLVLPVDKVSGSIHGVDDPRGLLREDAGFALCH